MLNKPISLSIASAGCGKTEAFIQTLPSLFEQQKRVVVALPTKELADDVEKRIAAELRRTGCDVKPHVIHSGNQNNVRNALEGVLKNKIYQFVICTHEGITGIAREASKGWIVVLDEVPRILEMSNCNLDQVERRSIYEVAEIKKDKLVIKSGKKTLIQERLAKLKSRIVDTTLSDNEKNLYEALCAEMTIWVDPEDAHGKQAFRIIKIIDYKSVINHSDEFHIMCASISDTLFEGVCNWWGASYMPSIFSPQKTKYKHTSRVRIYPLLKDAKFSKGLYLSKYENGFKGKRESFYTGGQWIDNLMTRVVKEVGEEKCLIFVNKGVMFKWLTNRDQWEYCAFDSRGSNHYRDYKNAVVLFCCNADGLNRRNFGSLEEITGISAEEWEKRWDVTQTYEMAYQDVARTAVRMDVQSDEVIKLFVPDMYHVEYLKRFFPDAIVDRSIIQEVKTKVVLRTPPEIVEYIYCLYDDDIKKQKDIVDKVLIKFNHNITRQTVSRILEQRKKEFVKGFCSDVLATPLSVNLAATL